ncbi:MAG: NADH-quinone oxidoreductase subunit N [Chloroflexi bacterium]|nr:MAG: NADH-quinone oxidoreductase subunit N [Chloroflexota bacterium]
MSHPSPFAAAVDLIPEGILLLGALVCGSLAVVHRRVPAPVYRGLSALTLVAAAGSSLVYLRGLPTSPSNPGYVAWSEGLVVDRYSIFFVPVLCAFTLMTVLASAPVAQRIRPHVGEYHALLLTATLGAVLLASAREMIAFYVALELLSISLYILVGISKTEPRSSEAAFKYLVYGAAASAVLLYGLALLYGLTGRTDLVGVAHGLGSSSAAAALALTLVIAGLTFKLGAVPLHQWVPDVYEGATAPVAGFIATLSKAAGFAILLRVVVTTFPVARSTWLAVIALAAALSMVLGNVVALAQSRMKRLLAYSSIGQAGFILVGVVAYPPDQQGVAAVLFYLFTYGIVVLGVFAAVAHVEGSGAGEEIDDYRGLSRRSPIAAAALAVGMVSLIGIPPTIGFFAKLFVFEAAVQAGYAWLVLLALAMTVVSAAYYLRVLRVMYVDAGDQDAAPLPWPPRVTLAAIAVGGLAALALGAAVQPLFALAGGAAGPLTVR